MLMTHPSALSFPGENHLLAALPVEVQARLQPALEVVPLPLGKVLYESGDQLRHVYFLTDSIISLLYVMDDGASAEIAVVGNDGVVGVALFMGGDSTPSRAVVQSAGHAFRLSAGQLKKEFNRHHSIDQQLCRWLLLSLDRLPGDKLAMTQQLIANMLGVRREGVTTAARKLQNKAVIDYHRGQITLLDRGKLEKLCCEWYAVVRKEAGRLLPYARKARFGTLRSFPTP